MTNSTFTLRGNHALKSRQPDGRVIIGECHETQLGSHWIAYYEGDETIFGDGDTYSAAVADLLRLEGGADGH